MRRMGTPDEVFTMPPMFFPLRIRLLVAALAAAAFLALPTAASPALRGKATTSRIVMFGAHSGSHLRLTTRGSRVVVSGNLAGTRPAGCRVIRRRRAAVCPAARATGIELNMGPGGDLVEVLDRLPVPLTVYLGGGSDKFIGNGERDFCYPQGSRRNRCVGGGGNDVCITGPRNTDCVGGPGNDLCKASSGSDGCWGGPGRDVCYMGSGEDGCHGGPGNDRLYGGPGADQLYGGPGYDYCNGGRGVGRSHECEAGPRH
jgi:Ca2+-binding RTX toxin-like protein